MNIDISWYERACDNFARRSPTWAAEVDKYIPRHGFMIRAILRNGDCVDYDDRTETYRYITKGAVVNPDDISDDDCREVFARNLSDIMRVRGIVQGALSERTGISQVMISKYLSRKSTPTLTTLKKIAHALNCSVEELIY